jgi:hypothetical protein
MQKRTKKNYGLVLIVLFLSTTNLTAQTDVSTGTFWHPNAVHGLHTFYMFYAIAIILTALLPRGQKSV